MADNRFMEAEQYMEASLSFFLMNKLEDALRVLDKAIECDPNFAEAYNKKGDCYIKLGRIQEALECYLKSKELNPNIQNNYYDLGRTYLILGNYQESMNNFKQAYSMKAQDDIHAFIGKIYFDQGMYDEAKSSFENLLGDNQVVAQAGNSNTMAFYYYAQILLKKGDVNKANLMFDRIIEKYDRLSKSKKNLAEAYYYIGKCQFFKGNYEEAVKNLQLAVEYDTDKIYNHYSFDMFYSDADAFAALAEAQSQLGHVSEAKENILKAIELEPENKNYQELKVKLGF